MNYLNTQWTKQSYPAAKRYFWWKCPAVSGADLYTDKAKQRGVIQEKSGFLIKVVVSVWGDGVKVVGVYPRPETSGHKVRDWLDLTRQGNIPVHDIEWADDLQHPY